MLRIHIVGCGPRTGTTLMAESMIACFEIDIHNKHEDRIFAWPPRWGRIFLTKAPKDILVAETALHLMNNLHVIYMLRDPRDMISSRHGLDPDRYWAGLRYWKTYSPIGRKLEFHPRFITIRYEELIAQPDVVQDKLSQRMPFLIERARFSRFSEYAQPSKESTLALKGLRPPSPASVGNWRNHRARVAGQIQLHGSVTPDLIAYGYEPDDAWERELNDVEPDLTPSHFPERFSRGNLALITLFATPRTYFAKLGHYRLSLLLVRPFQFVSIVLRKLYESVLALKRTLDPATPGE